MKLTITVAAAAALFSTANAGAASRHKAAQGRTAQVSKGRFFNTGDFSILAGPKPEVPRSGFEELLALFGTPLKQKGPEEDKKDKPVPYGEDEYSPYGEDEYGPYREDEYSPYREDEYSPYEDDEYAPHEDEPIPYEDEPIPYDKDGPVPYVVGGASARYRSEQSDHRAHHSRIERHKHARRAHQKRQKGPDPDKVDQPEDANAPLLEPLLDRAAQRYKPLIPKKLGVKEDEVNHQVKENERVAIHPKNKPKPNNHEFLEGLIGKVRQPKKAPDASGDKNQTKETTNQKDRAKESHEELLGDVIDKVEQRVKPQTPTFSADTGKDEATEDVDEELLEDVMEKVEDRVKPQIPREKGEAAEDDDEALQDLMEQDELRHKTRGRRWWFDRPVPKLSPIEERLEKKQLEDEGKQKWRRGFRGYSRQYLEGLLRLEGEEMCRKHPKNCIKPKTHQRYFTPEALKARARLEDMKRYAMMHTSPDDFRAQRFRMDQETHKVPELLFWIHPRKGIRHRPVMSAEEEELYDNAMDELGVLEADLPEGQGHHTAYIPGVLWLPTAPYGNIRQYKYKPKKVWKWGR